MTVPGEAKIEAALREALKAEAEALVPDEDTDPQDA